MSTLENTISMMRVLPETEQIKIQDFTRKLFQHYEDGATDEAVGRFLKPMSLEDFMRDVEVAEAEFTRGEYQEMGEALDEISRELKI